jgi:hypothetical protein
LHRIKRFRLRALGDTKKWKSFFRGIYLEQRPTANASPPPSLPLSPLLHLPPSPPFCSEIYYMKVFHFFLLIKKQKYEVALCFAICFLASFIRPNFYSSYAFRLVSVPCSIFFPFSGEQCVAALVA